MKWMMLAAAVAAAGCAAATSQGDGTRTDGTQATSSLTNGQCFRGDDVNNFNVGDDHTLYVSTRQGYVFEARTAADCFGPSSDAVSLEPLGGSNPRICVGSQARVTVQKSRSVPMTCVAQINGPIRDSAVSGLRSRQD